MLGPSQPSHLESLIAQACDPYRSTPDLGLNLEIADYVNQKKANTPREAVFTTLKYVNSRIEHVNMLALTLLDILVKNGGYPIHLQIATKEFLNELVRRFPERPPERNKPAMARILQLIHEWKMSICITSKHKDDLAHIRDMHRLLTYKGYRFPDIDRSSTSILNSVDELKTPEEREEEDRAAQAAKLQELIRRGKPKDLAAAQQLMKVMAGADPGSKPDYAKQTQKELNGIQQRILLLNEMLNNAKPEEKFVEGDAYEQLAQRSRQVQPKLQQWIAESEEANPDQTDKLLLLNDLINNVLVRYKSFKAGDRTATAEIDPSLTASDPSKVKRAAEVAKQANLIDFDDPEPAEKILSNAKQKEQASSESGGLDSIFFGGGATQPMSSSSSSSNMPLSLFDPLPTQPGHGAIQIGGNNSMNATQANTGSSGMGSYPIMSTGTPSSSRPVSLMNGATSSTTSSTSNINNNIPFLASTPNKSSSTPQTPSQQAAPAPAKKRDPFDDLADLF